MNSVFFYGLFMDAELLMAKGLNPLNPLNARIEGYGIRIGKRASLVKSDNECVYGIVMTLQNKELETLYLEKSVSDYLPETLTAVTSNNEKIEVTAYILPPAKIKGRNKEYARSLAVLAGKIGLPAGYVELIRRWSE